MAQKRWKEVEGVWPMAKQPEESSNGQKSYVHSNLKHLLTGLLQCKVCGGAIVQVCGKGGGYCGRYNAKRKTCTDKLTIRKKRIEGLLLDNLNDVFLTTESFKNVYDKELKLKRYQCEKVQAELQNLLNSIKVGNFSKTVSEALTDAENRSEKLKGEMQGLEFQRTTAFKAPPREWIQFKLDKLHETLTQNTEAAALSLKNLLGTIELEPVLGSCEVENGKIIEVHSFYITYTNINTLALLEGEDKGTNWCLLRRGWDSNPRYACNAHTLSKRAP
jgi:hypothetical protein